MIDNRKIRIGFFKSEEAAAQAYDERAAPLGRPVNFPSLAGGHHDSAAKDADEQSGAAAGAGLSPRQKSAKKRGSHGVRSRYTGVYYESKSGKWKVQIKVDREVIYLGLYDSEEEAARVYDARGAAPLGRPVNFPVPGSGQVQARKQGTSKFMGVYWSGARKSWEAVALESRTYEHLGYFELEDDAARAYDAHMEITHGRPPKNFPRQPAAAAADDPHAGAAAAAAIGFLDETTVKEGA